MSFVFSSARKKKVCNLDDLRPSAITDQHTESGRYFYTRDAMLARVIAIATCLSVCPSVCLSVTSRYCVKTKKASVMISSLPGSPEILVF